MKNITIGKPQVRSSSKTISISFDVGGLTEGTELLFQIPKKHETLIGPAMGEAAILALLPEAMRRGRGLTSRAEVSAGFTASIRDYTRAQAEIFPHKTAVPIEFEEVWDGAPRPKHSGLGFSAGVDSFYSLLTLLENGGTTPKLLF